MMRNVLSDAKLLGDDVQLDLSCRRMLSVGSASCQ